MNNLHILKILFSKTNFNYLNLLALYFLHFGDLWVIGSPSTATRKFVPNLHHHDLSLISPFKGLSHGFIEVIDELHNLAI